MFPLFFNMLAELHNMTALLETLDWEESALEKLLEAWSRVDLNVTSPPDHLIRELVSQIPEDLTDYTENIELFLKTTLLPYLINNMSKFIQEEFVGEC
tara:strand:- start:1768 stop:2061 length:294 start_codon:yes stop_codon:yes gene_type:complete